jgi:integrase
VLGRDTAGLNSVRAKAGPHLPVVFSEKEVAQVLGLVDGTTGLMLRLCYGSGLRVSECVSLRVKDLDFDHGILFVRRGKGDKDRSTLLPSCLMPPLKAHLERIRIGIGVVPLRRVSGSQPLPINAPIVFSIPIPIATPTPTQYRPMVVILGSSAVPLSRSYRRQHVTEQLVFHQRSEGIRH